MAFFAVIYKYAHGSQNGRNAHRPEHMKFLTGLFESGLLVVSGPTDASGLQPGALLIVRGDSADEVEATMSMDPFARLGFVERTVKSWDPKFGATRLESSPAGGMN